MGEALLPWISVPKLTPHVLACLTVSTVMVGVTGCASDRTEIEDTSLDEPKHADVVPASEDETAFITGVVKDKAGNPVHGAELLVRDANAEESQDWEVVALPDGDFRIGPFPNETVLLIQARLPDVGFSKVNQVVVPTPGVILTLMRGGILRGRVIDDEGHDLATFDASALWEASLMETLDIDSTHTDGTYELGPIDADYVQLSFGSDGYSSGHMDWTTIPDGEITDLPDIVLEKLPVHTISGVVLDAKTNERVANATVRESHKSKYADTTTTDAEGRFTITFVGQREVELIANAVGYATWRDRVITGPDPVVIRLIHGGAIRGVLMAGGVPVSGTVSLHWPRYGGRLAQTEVSEEGGGSFAFENLIPGDYAVVGSVQGYLGQTEHVHAIDGRTQDVQIDVAEAGEESGTVNGLVTGFHDSESGQVTLMQQEEAENESTPGAEINFGWRKREISVDVAADSRFDFPRVPAGSYLAILSTSQERKLMRWTDVSGGESVEIVFRLGSSTLSGTVTKEGSVDQSCNCLVRAAPSEDDGVRRNSHVSLDGTYSITGLNTGVHSVEVVEFPRVQMQGPVIHHAGEVQIDGSVGFDILISNTSTLTGMIQSSKGVLERAVVILSPVVHPEASEYRSITASDGRFSFIGLKKSKYLLRAYKNGYGLVEIGVDVLGPAVDDLLIVLAEDSGIPVRFQTAYRDLFNVHLRSAGISIDIHVNQDGTGRVPSSLVGRNLLFWAEEHRPIGIDNWDGKHLVVPLQLNSETEP